MSLAKKFITGALLISSAALVSCTGGGTVVVGGGGGGGGSTYGTYQSGSISATTFIDALNRIEGYGDNASFIELYADETIRSTYVGEDDWFVIYDDKFDENKAVSLQYIRSIVYYDYYSNSTALAEEFRAIETDDILAGDLNGDYFGDDYEVVDYDFFTGTFVGRNSGFDYEDGASTKDVSLLSAEADQKSFLKKAANVSLAYSVNIETAMSLVTLGEKAEQMKSKNAGELTIADQLALAGDVEKFTGASMIDILAASTDEAAKDDMIAKVAAKIGTSAANLENKLLPELLNINTADL